MRTTVDELKTLYVKMGGSIEDVAHLQTDAELIDKIEDIAGQKELPSVTTDDNGKILAVAEGTWGKATMPTELPSVTTDDNGKILAVAEGIWGKATIPTELPSVTASDNGKVLGVTNGAWGSVTKSKIYTCSTIYSLTEKSNGSVGGPDIDGYSPQSQSEGCAAIRADVESGVDVTLRIRTTASGAQPKYVDLKYTQKETASGTIYHVWTSVSSYSKLVFIRVSISSENECRMSVKELTTG